MLADSRIIPQSGAGFKMLPIFRFTKMPKGIFMKRPWRFFIFSRARAYNIFMSLKRRKTEMDVDDLIYGDCDPGPSSR